MLYFSDRRGSLYLPRSQNWEGVAANCGGVGEIVGCTERHDSDSVVGRVLVADANPNHGH